MISEDVNGAKYVYLEATDDVSASHTHEWSTTWSNNRYYHWHECVTDGCTITNNMLKDGYGAHIASDWITVTEATETTSGLKHKVCTVCGYELETEAIPMIAHTHEYGTDWKADESGHWHECSCGEKDEVIAHTASDWIVVTPATSTETGLKHKVCTVCGYELETEEIPATGNGGGGSGTSAASYAITVADMTNGSVVANYNKATAGMIVTLTVTAADAYKLDNLEVTDANGKAVSLKDLGNGKYSFTMPASIVTVKASFTAIGQGFTDVDKDSYGYEAIQWAVANGITKGTSDTTFSPNLAVTRAEIVTFLWRLAGSPVVEAENPFVDVNENDYYYNAVQWAVANGITKGTSDTTFSPNSTVTRAQGVTFLWRMEDCPAASGETFVDVDTSAYYAKAVTWAVQEGVTVGTGDNKFSPEEPISRMQAVTFMYRLYQN